MALVLVAGGGSAGLAAAVAAARAGAPTLLVERHGMLGGMATAALVHSLCGLYEPADDAPPRWANPGFAVEFAERLIARGGATGPVRMGRVHVLPHQPALFARVADEFAFGTPGLSVRLHTEILGADPVRGTVDLVTRGRRETVTAAAWIDASGDAALATLAGAETEQAPADRLQRPAFIFGLHGVAADALDEDARLRLAARLAHAVKEGEMPAGALGAAVRATGRGGEVYVTIDLAGAEDYDPADPAALTALEVEGRALAVALTDFLRGAVAGFDAATISAFPARVGIRESRRVVGRARLEAADLEAGRTSADAVARATWPMELRETNRGPRLRHHPGADIPAGCLRARDVERLFVAGRCLSCSHEAQASIRVMGTCLATGEAAGRAAATFVA